MIRALNNTSRRLIAAATLALGVGLASPHAAAADVVTLTDGTSVEGEIVREVSGAVWIEVKIGTITERKFIAPDKIAKIERDVVREPEPQQQADQPGSNRVDLDTERDYAPGTPRGVVITLEGTVGISFSSEHMKAMVPDLKKEVGDDGTGIVVLKINSGGGFLLDIERISDVIEYDYKPNFHTVAWIESAISAAAMSSHTLPEIYFFPEGNYGACTGWSGGGQAVAGRSWFETAHLMERISARGGYDPRVMYAMMGSPHEPMPLAARRNPETGIVEWIQEEGGDGWTTINPAGEVLTVNSVQAVDWDFADGIANNVEDLTQLMGYQEVNWVGRRDPGLRYPISDTERKNQIWRSRLAEDEQRAEVTRSLYEYYKQLAQGSAQDIRGVFIGKARQKLQALRRFYDMNSVMAIVIGINPDAFEEWYEDEETTLKNIARGGG